MHDNAVNASAETGLYSLPREQQDAITTYVTALLAAKDAGVAGPAIQFLQRFVDKVVRERVADALAGSSRWEARQREMTDEMAAWERRKKDRVDRAARKAADAAHSQLVIGVLRRYNDLTAAQLDELTDRWTEAIAHDTWRTERRLPGIQQPDYASLRHRARRIANEHQGAPAVYRLTTGAPDALRDAALAVLSRELLPETHFAILYGPWAAVVDSDDSYLAVAFSEEADVERQNFLDLDPEAWRTPEEPDLHPDDII
jgi:hypothetical protein